MKMSNKFTAISEKSTSSWFNTRFNKTRRLVEYFERSLMHWVQKLRMTESLCERRLRPVMHFTG